METDSGTGVVQVEFKGERREFFLNAKNLPLAEGDYVIVQVERGRDFGKVVRTGEALEKMGKARPVTQQVIRKATDEDLAKYQEIQRKEAEAQRVCEEKIRSHDLKMKLVDVEYQLDGSKITFYFTAEERVDFRELVKDLAGIYKTRIELRQIGVRDEAKRLGGYGSCGRKFCCTTFLQEFEPVTLKMARDQSLSVSPTKISGACGRLMCCLAYERDYYMEVAKQLPKIGTKVMTPYGEAIVTKIDIFAQAVTAEDEQKNEMRLSLDQIKKLSVGERVFRKPRGKGRGRPGEEGETAEEEAGEEGISEEEYEDEGTGGEPEEEEHEEAGEDDVEGDGEGEEELGAEIEGEDDSEGEGK